MNLQTLALKDELRVSCISMCRANLNLLEGWACQVGFKDAVLHYLAKFSSTIDLLATPSEQLLQVRDYFID